MSDSHQTTKICREEAFGIATQLVDKTPTLTFNNDKYDCSNNTITNVHTTLLVAKNI